MLCKVWPMFDEDIINKLHIGKLDGNAPALTASVYLTRHIQAIVEKKFEFDPECTFLFVFTNGHRAIFNPQSNHNNWQCP